MQRTHPFHLAPRHTSAPSYGPTYFIPLIFVVCEVYRLGNWLASNGTDFSGYREQSSGYALMVAVFVVQVLAEAVFLAIAWAGRHEQLMRRLTNVAFGLFFSSCVLAFDYALQVAF
jgi:hypothetical protein